jgi:integrase
VISGYGLFLAWLQEQGELDGSAMPSTRATRERLQAYLQYLTLRKRGHAIHGNIQSVADMMRALALGTDWRWIQRAAGRLRARTVPARDKRSRLRPIEGLAAQGYQMMARAENDTLMSTLGRAALFRDGLFLSFLGSHPLRRGNVAGMRIGVHIVEHGDQFVLKIAAPDMKNRRPYEAVTSARLSQAIKRYLEHHRRVLLTAKGRWHVPAADAFWISRDGSPCSEQTFENIFRKRTGSRDRKPLSPHLVRSCAATSVAIAAPHLVYVIPGVLGHASPRTNEQYYNLAGSLEASRAHSSVLEELERELVRSTEEPEPEDSVKPPSVKSRRRVACAP